MTPETRALQARIVELRDRRWHWNEIATAVDRDQSWCRELYIQAMAATPMATVTSAREEELRTVDLAIRELLDITMDEDVSPRSRIEGWNSVRTWSERRAKLLGLDAPVRKEVSIISEDTIDAELKRLEQQVGKLPAAEEGS